VGGGGFGVTVGLGAVTGVAWFPLGPRDVWVPSYRCSPRYVTNVNVTNTRVVTVTQVTNVYDTYTVNRVVNVNEYTYARNVSAVTVVDRETFVNARPVAKDTIRVTPEEYQQVRVVDKAPIAPTRNSYVASTAKLVPPAQRPVRSFYDRKVVAKLPPPIPPAGGHEPRIVDSAKPEHPAEPAPHAQTPDAERRARAQEPAPRGQQPNAAPMQNGYVNQNRRPARENSASENDQRRENQEREYQQHPAVKFAPPARATDDKYDVHPPLSNNKPAEQPKKEEPKKQESKSEGHSGTSTKTK